MARKIFTFLIFLIFLFLGTVLCINFYVCHYAKPYILTVDEIKDEDFDCILVLGAGVWKNNQPSPMLEDRLKQGISLYHLGVSEKMLMSGDHGTKEYDEVNVMKRYAIENDVPSSDIFMDHAGFSTYESMYRAKEIFEAKKIIIVTQEYHLYRAIYNARKLGLDAYGISSDLRVYGGQEYRDFREILARNKDFIYTIIKPEPTYLGEKIPVFGDGDVTNDIPAIRETLE